MLVVFTVLLCIFILYIAFQHIRNRQWSLVLSTYGYNDYFKAISKLKSEGIPFRVNTPYRGLSSRTDRFMDSTQYDIFVKSEAVHQALKVLHRSN